MKNPKKISVRPAIGTEGNGIVVWVYGRRVQVQLVFENFDSVENCINEAVEAWQHAIWRLSK